MIEQRQSMATGPHCEAELPDHSTQQADHAFRVTRDTSADNAPQSGSFHKEVGKLQYASIGKEVVSSNEPVKPLSSCF